MSDTIVKRPYRSPLREAQAEATRQRILEAGLALFAERGYPGTSVVEIARAAGVSPETIYASVGSKRGIIDGWLERIDASELGEVARDPERVLDGEPSADLAALAELTARFWSINGTLVRVLRKGIGDPEIGEAWLARQELRRGLIHRFLARWPKSALRRGLDLERAVDIAWMLTSDETFDQLVSLRGWTVEQHVTWVRETLQRELLRSGR